MTKQEFIFSNQLRHRVLRHVTFWTVWTLAYLLLFHYPIHSFKGWNISDSSSTFQKLGILKFVLKTLVFNAFLAVVVPQAAFTYTLLYFLLPAYFSRKRSLIITIFYTVAAVLLFFFVFIAFKYNVVIGNYFFGTSKTLTGNYTYEVASYAALRDMLTSLPIISGFALMIKMVKRWWLKQKETEQLANEKTKAELQLLKAQIHPHFLFNTLNNIYYFTLAGSAKAPEMIKKLSGLLNYILNECNQTHVSVKKEIAMIKDYMALEKIRYGEKLKLDVEILETTESETLIAPLLLLPFVENSFKHGTSKMIDHAWIKLRITTDNNELHFFIINSRPKNQEPLTAKGNIGLKNVKNRLQLLYFNAHELNIVSEPESFTVFLKIKLKEMASFSVDETELKLTASYALA